MVQTSSQSTVNKIEMRLRGKGRGSIVFQQDYADCGTPSAVKSTFHRMYTDGMLMRLAHGIYYYPKEDKEYGLGILFKHSSSGKNFAYKSELMMLVVTAMRAIGENKITDEERNVLVEHAKNVNDNDFNHDIKLAPAWVRKILIAR